MGDDLHHMQGLYNRSGELIAYCGHNMLLHPDNMSVLGLVLGNCVFDQRAKVLGKLFGHKIYNLSGEVLAEAHDGPPSIHSSRNLRECMADAWSILTLIKDHSCPWVPAGKTWAQYSLAEHIYT